MKTIKIAASVAVLSLSIALAIACGKAAPEPPEGSKVGVQANISYEVASLVVAQGVLDFPAAATLIDGGFESPTMVVGPGSSSIPLSSCKFAPSAALTASNTQYATITVTKKTPLADASAPSTTLAWTTTAITAADAGVDASTGSWSIWNPVSIPVVSGAFVSPGDVVTVAVSKTGGGVVTPIGQLQCFTSLN